MTLWNNKKGQSGDDGSGMFVAGSKIHYYWVLLLLLIPAFIFFVLSTKGYVSSLENQPKELAPDLIAARITNICFSPKNNFTNEIEQSVIDLKKFNEEELNQCFIDWNSPRVELILESADNSFESRSLFTQKGGLKTVLKRLVLVKTTDDKKHPAILTIKQQ